MDAYDVLVVGAGVAGCGAAVAFGRQGRRVLLVERNLSEPDRIVGELLQPGGVEALSELGLGSCLDGIDAFPVKGYHLQWKDDEATWWFCPPAMSSGKDPANGRLKAPEGRSFHHGRFVMKLREAARRQPNVHVRETTVLEILRNPGTGHVVGIKCSGDGSEPKNLYASLTVLADGSTSNFRSQFSSHRPKSNSRFWALELLDVELPLAGYAYAVLGRGSPLLLYRIGPRETRILIDIPDKIQQRLRGPRAVRSYITDRVLPTVPKHVQPGLQKAVEAGRLRSMPNCWLPSTETRTPGIVVIGDALNMRHPITGAGMTVALKDAVLLSQMLESTDLSDLNVVLKITRQFHWQRKWQNASLNILAQVLYSLFASQDNGLDMMQYGFIRYVQGGEKNFAQPAALMGGIIESPFLLLYHILAITLHSMRLHLRESQVICLPVALLQYIVVFGRALALIAPWIVAELWDSGRVHVS